MQIYLKSERYTKPAKNKKGMKYLHDTWAIFGNTYNADVCKYQKLYIFNNPQILLYMFCVLRGKMMIYVIYTPYHFHALCFSVFFFNISTVCLWS